VQDGGRINKKFSLSRKARTEAWQTFRDRAALSPLTGRVLAVGWWNPDESESSVAYILEGKESVSEKEVIEHFLSLADAVLSDVGRLACKRIEQAYAEYENQFPEVRELIETKELFC